MAQGALESFAERAANRATSFEDRARRDDSPVARVQTGEVAIMIESALALSRQVAASLHQHAAEGTPVSTEERVRVRAAVAYTIRQSTDAVAALARIGGGTAFRLDLPVQRHLRDSLMLANHAVLNYEANVSVLGDLTLGNAPRTMFL